MMNFRKFTSFVQIKCCFPEDLGLLSPQLDGENEFNVTGHIRRTFNKMNEENYNKYAKEESLRISFREKG